MPIGPGGPRANLFDGCCVGNARWLCEVGMHHGGAQAGRRLRRTSWVVACEEGASCRVAA